MKKIILITSIIIMCFLVGFIWIKYYKDFKMLIIKDKTKEVIKIDDNKKFGNGIDYYKKEYLDRYLKYKESHNNFSDEEIITRVNIGLDHDFYTNIKESKDLNKTTILVNKYTSLKSDYIPNNLENVSSLCGVGGTKLVRVARIAFEEMCSAAKKDGFTIRSWSAYRSYNLQKDTYNYYFNRDGIKADTYSARAGHSEHQTGLATDVDNGKVNFNQFANTQDFVWMQNNAYKYGFIMRYPENKTDITGYVYESWHYRYVGVDIATYIKNNNITYDEYYVRFIEST